MADLAPSAACPARRPAAPPEGLRILHVLDHSVPLHSGYSFRTLSLLREQRRRGWTTAHLTTPKHTAAGPSPEAVENFLFHRTPPPLPPRLESVPVLAEGALIRATARRIVEVAAVERPDILHAHSPVLNALAALWAARRLGLPVVYEVRGFWEDAAVSHGTTAEGSLRYHASRALETWALRRSDAAVAICEGLRRDILARGIAPERLAVVGNGVDSDAFAFGAPADPELRASLGLDGKIVLGFLGSFYAYEGLNLLLSALPAILRARPEVAVLLVGGGQVEAALKDEARRLGIEGAVRFAGRVPHATVQRYYDLVDIFVYPRHAMRLTETVTPLKPLEAMAQGGIVLASDVGGHCELVRHGETGYLFPAGRADALAAAVLQLIADRERWPAVVRRARLYVERERSWAATTAPYEALYAGVLAARPSRRRTAFSACPRS
jgi:glycogen(starch) synthase